MEQHEKKNKMQGSETGKSNAETLADTPGAHNGNHKKQTTSTGQRSDTQMGMQNSTNPTTLEMPKAQMDKEQMQTPASGEMPGLQKNQMPLSREMTNIQSAKPKIRIGIPRPHVFEKPGHRLAENIIEHSQMQVAKKVGFDYPATLRGSTTHFNVYYDPGLATTGQIIADGVLGSCEMEYTYLQIQFGGIAPGPFNIIIAAGIGGAYHYGCSATDLYCDADTSASPDVDHTRMLLVAEEVEVFSAAQAKGWDCGSSNGEGISRILATELYPAELNGFTSAAYWLDNGRPDFVNTNDPTDRNYLSIGCSVVFLNYLRYQLGYRWEEIVAAGAPTLAQTYTILTGQNNGFDPFKTLLQTRFPQGIPCGLTNDNPFPIVVPGTWSGWEDLGGIIQVSPHAVCWDPNRIDVFARGTDNAMYHRWWDGANWGGWEDLGGIILNDPVAVSWGANRLDVFAEGTDGSVYHRWWDGANWGGWEDLGGVIIGNISAVCWGPDRIDLFARGTDMALYHRWWDGANWGGWESLGGVIIGDPVAVSWGANRLDVFAQGTDGAVYHRWWDGSNWGGWEDLGGIITSNISAVCWGPDRIDLFARGTDLALYHRWWDGANWGGWESLGGIIISDPEVVSWGANRLDIFAEGTDGAVYQRWWDGSNWGGWESLGGVITSNIAPVSWAPNRIDLFVRGTDNAMYHQWYS